jgi:NAD(P)-dependent dehydrogenase (short-subunit alcohol dehydrogenase family)
MIPRGSGSIVHLTSVTAYSPEPKNFATHAYAAAKGALISLTKAMAAYYAASGIRVNAIAPGVTRTPMSLRAQTDEKILALLKTKQPLAGSLIDPDDVARAALFLLSDSARYITGQVIGVDAGWEVS